MAGPLLRWPFVRAPRRLPVLILLASLLAGAVLGCGDRRNPVAPGAARAGSPNPDPSSDTPALPPARPLAPPETFVGAGDIAVCNLPGAEQTARLLDGIAGTVFTAGDNTYPTGSARSFKDCYGPTWGRHKHRTRPSPGNHDYDEPGAAPYFEYFGANAGDGRGYYSFVLGAWLVLSLNSNIGAADGSAQMRWVEAELAANRSACTIAYWHHPVITSGPNGDNPHMRPMWQLMARAGVDIVVSGHDHIYERYMPMDADLWPAPQGGVRQFIAGTGGARPYATPNVRPQSEVRASVSGVLKLTLNDGSYDWEFVGVPGATFHDAGTTSCH